MIIRVFAWHARLTEDYIHLAFHTSASVWATPLVVWEWEHTLERTGWWKPPIAR